LLALSSLLAVASSLTLPGIGSISIPGLEDAASCFPAVGFNMPSNAPDSLDGWWCNMNDEYAFLGFSYEISDCQSSDQLKREFADIRNRFKGRYVRLYGACDQKGYYDKVIDAAWEAGIGIHALIWFGFNGDNKWKTRRDNLISTLHSNPKAKYVTRVVQFGSEPLFDDVLSPEDLAAQVTSAKAKLADLNIPVTVSDMAYGYQKNGNAPDVLEAIDIIDAHMLPFFSRQASTSDQSWPIVETDLNWFIDHGLGKKIILSENGWPSKTYSGVKPNSPNAVANVHNEEGYYQLLDAHCNDFKAVAGGGVGWFAHLYSDSQEPGYGIYDDGGDLKFSFSARISC